MSAPAVAVSADGKKFVAAWKDVRAGEPNVYWAFSSTPSFGKESPLHEETKGEQNYPSLAVEPSGTAWGAWMDKRSGKQQIWVRSSSEGDQGRPLSDAGEQMANFPVVACNAGIVVAVYEVKKDGKNAVAIRLIK